jgi:hypothetical protein
MIEEGKYYKMVKRNYTHRFYVETIIRMNDNLNIRSLYAIYYSGKSNFFDSNITNSDFWNNENYEEITKDQFIMDYKGSLELPIKSDIFHLLIF